MTGSTNGLTYPWNHAWREPRAAAITAVAAGPCRTGLEEGRGSGLTEELFQMPDTIGDVAAEEIDQQQLAELLLVQAKEWVAQSKAPR